MKNPLCDELLLLQPTTTDVEDLYSCYISNFTFNAFLIITTVVFNSVTIQALRRASFLPKPLKTFLLSLAVSDLGVGVVAQPLYLLLLVRWLQKNNEYYPSCALYTVYALTGIFFSVSSFFGVMALSADRFLAIHLHLRYKECVTHKRVVSGVVTLWVLSIILSLFMLWVLPNVATAVHTTVCVACLSISAVFYSKIYLAVRRHKNQIQVLQVQKRKQDVITTTTDLTRSRKSAIGTFYVYLMFFICYVPLVCTFAATLAFDSSSAIKISTISSWTLVFFNSSLNPAIYCWKLRHLRHEIIDLLPNFIPNYRRREPRIPVRKCE
ncbi:adenosine receptor A2b-like [Stylophora pistillata]|uniref:adenosine receptor A2b-like n=1 Tax=Stylophora pistillata TaxID=50429 RepID=UPI000C05386B|nr:adenosine receptor A2b-like [Stylophora pistillata]